jgi:hypothetical protein
MAAYLVPEPLNKWNHEAQFNALVPECLVSFHGAIKLKTLEPDKAPNRGALLFAGMAASYRETNAAWRAL